MSIKVVPIEEEIKLSYLDYALSVIIGRAIPDARDGLKPVQRRILYSMYENKLYPDRQFRKCATVVGDVIGKYHPHGDMAVYDALVRMAQDFKMRYPLVIGQGNFGSIDGDPPAAYRYTEAKLSPVAMEMLKDIEENTVDFVPNFDGRLKEPVVLPSAVPNLLINGAEGIAVGVSTGIPPHNLSEIVDALILIIDNPDVADEKLLEVVKGPDFPTGGVILGTKGIRKMYLTGKGAILIRAKYRITERKGKPVLIFYEIPYGTSKAQIIKQISYLVQNKILEGIHDLRDESDKTGLRIVLELKKDVDVDKLLFLLFKYTDLQKKYYANLLAIVGRKPKLLTLKDALKIYLEHRKNVVTRRTRYRLEKAEKRFHILEGLLKALSYLDRIISIIKNSKNREEARKHLVEKFKFSNIQADAILDLRLYQLTRLERDNLLKEMQNLKKDIEHYRKILSSERFLYSVIKEELLEVKKKYGDRRKTEIAEEVKEEKREIRRYFLIFSSKGNVYVGENRNEFKLPVKNGERIIDGFTVSEKDEVLVLTSCGRVLKIKAVDVMPKISYRKKKKNDVFIKLRDNEEIVWVGLTRGVENYGYVVLVTSSGNAKRLKFSDILPLKSGTMLITLNKKEKEKVVSAAAVSDEDIVVISKSSGKVRVVESTKIPVKERKAKGIKIVKVLNDEEIVNLSVLDISLKPVSLTENAYLKILSVDDFKITRSLDGSVFCKIDDQTGKFLGIKWVKDNFYLVSEDRKVKIFSVEDMPVQSKKSRGKKIWDKKIIGFLL